MYIKYLENNSFVCLACVCFDLFTMKNFLFKTANLACFILVQSFVVNTNNDLSYMVF